MEGVVLHVGGGRGGGGLQLVHGDVETRGRAGVRLWRQLTRAQVGVRVNRWGCQRVQGGSGGGLHHGV